MTCLIQIYLHSVDEYVYDALLLVGRSCADEHFDGVCSFVESVEARGYKLYVPERDGIIGQLRFESIISAAKER